MMFCRNCGKEIPNGINFCNYCGAAQNNCSAQDTQSIYQTNESQYSAVNSQPVYAEPRPPKNKSKGPLRFIVPIAVAAAAFAIGYFATGADQLKQPTAFDTPDSFTFEGLESPSIKEDAMEGETAEKNQNVTTESLEKTFRFVNEYGEERIALRYREDGVVSYYDGMQNFYDVSAIDPDWMETFKNGVNDAAAYLEESGTDSAFITIQESADEFSMQYAFGLLESDPDMAELAAEFIGLETEDGKIMINSVEEELLGLGFTLE